MSSSSAPLVQCRGFGPARHGPPLGATLTRVLGSMDAAAEQLMVHGDFEAAFDACERGLASLVHVEKEDTRYGEFKSGLCTLGIQALAELNQWRGVLCWVLQHYEQLEEIPAKIMQMCILLYTKVGEQGMVRDTARLWLSCPANRGSTGFRTVAELYLLYVLLPLGCTEEAQEFILGEVGSDTFTEDQRRAALDAVKEKQRPKEELPTNSSRSPSPGTVGHSDSTQGAVIHKLKAMLSFLYRRLRLGSAGPFLLRRVLLAVIILYMIFVRIDPALPSSFPWISKLLQLLKPMWNVMFAPYYRAIPQNKEQ